MQVYTVKDVAEILKVSSRTVERLIEQEHLRAMHVGRRLRVTQEALAAYMVQAEGGEDRTTRTTL
jgi:excisionase family DNA binding protein